MLIFINFVITHLGFRVKIFILGCVKFCYLIRKIEPMSQSSLKVDK